MMDRQTVNLTAEFFVNYLLHSTIVFVAVVGLLAVLKRTRFPELRVLVCKVALILPVVTTFAATVGVLPHFGVDVPLAMTDVRTEPSPQPSADKAAVTRTDRFKGSAAPSERFGSDDFAHDEFQTNFSREVSADFLASTDSVLLSHTHVPFSLVAVVFWATGGLFGITLLWREVRKLEQIRRSSHMIKAGELFLAMNRLRKQLGVGDVELRVADDRSGPLAAGVRNPFLLLPGHLQPGAEGSEELSCEERDAVLAHELAHVAQGDPKWNLISQIVQRVFFFQPFTVLVTRQLQKEMDFVADAQAARVLGFRAGLASCLLRFAHELARQPNRGRVFVPAVGMASFRSTLGQRVETLLDESNGLRPLTRRSRTAFVTLMVAAFVLLSAVVPRATALPTEQLPSNETSETGNTPMEKHSVTLALLTATLTATLAPITAQDVRADEKPAATATLRTTPDELPEGIRRFNGMVVGRLAAKDIERGTFVVNVDAVSRVWRNSRAENPHSIVGKAIQVGGVSGKWLDVLVITRTGETIEFECQHDGDGLRFPGELLRKVAPYKPENYPTLPETFRGFQGALVADVVKKDPEAFEMIVRVSDVRDVWKKSAAKEPESIRGRSMLLAGFWNRKEAYHNLKPGDRIEFGVQHISRQSEHVSVAEFVRKAAGDKSAVSMKRMDRERGSERMGSGSQGFRGMLVGRLVSKDIERGTFKVKVDAVPRVWKNNRSRNPKTMIGQEVSAGGVAGKMLDALVVARVGDTVEFGALSDGEEIRVGEVLQKVAPVRPGDYPELPEAARGIQAIVTGKIVKKSEHLWGLNIEVSGIHETFGGNRAKDAEAIVGKPIMLGGFWNRKDTYHDLNVGDVIRCGVKHDQPQGDNLSVMESVRKVEE